MRGNVQNIYLKHKIMTSENNEEIKREIKKDFADILGWSIAVVMMVLFASVIAVIPVVIALNAIKFLT